MNCAAFEQRLDEGALDALEPQALAHAASCARCARALAAARSLDAAFARQHAAPRVAAPANFADGVMARVRLRQRRARNAFVSDPTPWWVGLAAQPTAIGAFALAALLAWRGPWLWTLTQQAFATGGAAASFATGLFASAPEWVTVLARSFAPSGGADWTTSLAIALCLSPVALVVGYALYRGAERMFEAPVRA